MCPRVANIFMARFEQKFIHNEVAPFYESVTNWVRFIDNIFFILTGTMDILEEFLIWLNLCDLNMKFTAHKSRKQVKFLDILI